MKEKTSSYFTTIVTNKNYKFVKHKKRKGRHAYPRTISVDKVYKLLNDSHILFPKMYKNTIVYYSEEYIESEGDINDIDRKQIIDNCIFYISQLNKINCSKIRKKVNWMNNSEFLLFQINNLKSILISKGYNKIYELNSLYKELDNNRKMTLIHGDIHFNNMIYTKKGIYLIDWELATYGDIAYELAIHFILMNYTESEKKYFIDNLCDNIKVNKDKLLHDINIYDNFEHYRKNILKILK